MNVCDTCNQLRKEIADIKARHEFTISACNDNVAVRDKVIAELRAENTGFRDLISEYQSYEHEVIRLRAELAAQQLKEGFVSVELAEEMFESLVEWSNYADDYFKKKWHLDDELAKYKALITASREK